jgi:flagellar P-ring protein precursor FlgI
MSTRSLVSTLRRMPLLWWLTALTLLAPFIAAASAQSLPQSIPIRDLTIVEGARAVRLVGYGLVTGLSGTGDRVTGGAGSRHTVQSVVNLLRNFDVQVPAEMLRTRNVAAVLVTAEVSPYLRAGGRFDIQVSSIGDAQSLRGGILWMTPLVAEAGGQAMAVAQGSVLVTEPVGVRNASRQSTSARVADGGIMEATFPQPEAARETRLLLKQPDLGVAQRIVDAIKSELRGDAKVEDPGSVKLELPRGEEGLAFLARVNELRILPTPVSRLLVDSRDGTVVAGADLVVLDGIVSADGITLSIGGAPAADAAAAGEALPTGIKVRDVVEALRIVKATPQQSAAIFLALRDAGAIRAEVVVR